MGPYCLRLLLVVCIFRCRVRGRGRRCGSGAARGSSASGSPLLVGTGEADLAKLGVGPPSRYRGGECGCIFTFRGGDLLGHFTFDLRDASGRLIAHVREGLATFREVLDGSETVFHCTPRPLDRFLGRGFLSHAPSVSIRPGRHHHQPRLAETAAAKPRPLSSVDVSKLNGVPDGASYTGMCHNRDLALDMGRGLGHTGVCDPRAGRGRCAGPRRGVVVSDEASSAQPFKRQRRSNVAGGRAARHVVTTSPEEEGALLRLALAQRVTIPRLLVESALASEGAETATERRATIAKLFELHRLLGAISRNVNQIAKATNATREEQPETFATLTAVRRTAERIDALVDELSLS